MTSTGPARRSRCWPSARAWRLDLGGGHRGGRPAGHGRHPAGAGPRHPPGRRRARRRSPGQWPRRPGSGRPGRAPRLRSRRARPVRGPAPASDRACPGRSGAAAGLDHSPRPGVSLLGRAGPRAGSAADRLGRDGHGRRGPGRRGLRRGRTRGRATRSGDAARQAGGQRGGETGLDLPFDRPAASFELAREHAGSGG